MMNSPDISQLLAQGEHHISQYEWDNAIVCFDKILEKDPNHATAAEGKRQAQEKKRVEANIRELLEKARSALEDRRFEDARIALNQAQTLGAQESILKYHAEIDRLRERIREEQRWQKRVNDTLKQVKELESAGNKELALQRLNELMRELTAEGLDVYGERIRSERERLIEEKELDDLILEAREAFQQEDFRRAYELIAMAHDQDAPSVKREYGLYKRTWEKLQRQLQEVEALLKEDRLEDAVAYLQDLRKQAPGNPDWKALWLRGHMDHGLDQYDQGREMLETRQFAEAQRAFAAAKQAFQKVLKVFPEHATAQPAMEEAHELEEIASLLKKAQRDYDLLALPEARRALELAREHYRTLKAIRGRGFEEVDHLIKIMSNNAAERENRIDAAKTALAEGKSWIEKREPALAYDTLRRGLEALGDAPDKALKKELLDAMHRAERNREEVMQMIHRAETTDDLEERLQWLHEAREKWPTAPKLNTLLAQTLVTAAEGALAQHQEEQAAAYCTEVSGLPNIPKSVQRRAQAILDKMNCQQRFHAARQEAQRLEKELSQGVPSADRYQKVVDLWRDALALAQQCQPESVESIQQSLQAMEDRLERWRQAEPLMQRGEEAERRGAWDEAASLWEQVIGILGDLALPAHYERLSVAQQRATKMTQVLNETGASLREAQAEYQRLGDQMIGAGDWAGLKEKLMDMERRLEEEARALKTTPSSWREVMDALTALRKRVEAIHQAQQDALRGRSEDIATALAQLQALAQQAPDDPVPAKLLDSLRTSSAAWMREEAQRLLEDAEAFIVEGELSDAEDRLIEVQRLGVADPEMQRAIRRLERMIRVWRTYDEKVTDGMIKESENSYVPARDAFAAALKQLISPHSGLADDIRTLLSQLLRFDPTVMHEEAPRQVYIELQEVLQNSPWQMRVFDTLQRWFGLSERYALGFLVSSLMEMQKYMEAYGLAREALRKFPDDPETQDNMVRARETLVQQMTSSMRKRVGEAKKYLEDGLIEKSLEVLAELDERFVQPVQQQFPEVIENEDEIQGYLREAIYLREELTRLQKKAERLSTIPQEAREALIKKDYQKVRELLLRAEQEDPERELKVLWKDLEGVRSQLQRFEQSALREQAGEILGRLEILESASNDLDEIKKASAELDEFWDMLMEQLQGGEEEETEKRIRRVLGGERFRRLKALRESLLQRAQEIATLQGFRARVEQAKSDEEKLEWLNELVRVTRGSERAEYERQLKALQDQITKQKNREAAWQRAMAALANEAFNEALEYFQNAQALGESPRRIAPYRCAAQSGMELKQYEISWEKQDVNLSKLEEDLTYLIEEVQRCMPCPEETPDCLAPEPHPAQKVLQKAQRLQKRVQKALDKKQQVTNISREVKKALARNDFETAEERLQALIDQAPGDPNIATLQDRIEKRRQAKALVEKAETFRKKGWYPRAITAVKQALKFDPDYAEASMLLEQLQDEKDAGEALARVKSLARGEQFDEARAELEKALKLYPNHPDLEPTQRLLKELEEAYWERRERSVLEAKSKGRYEEAWNGYKRLLGLAKNAPVEGDFRTRLMDVAESWAREVLQKIEQALAAGELDEALLQQVDRLLSLDPPLAESWIGQLKQAKQELIEQRYRVRLEEGKQALAEGDIERAEAISSELEGVSDHVDDFRLLVDVDGFITAVEEQKKAIQQQRYQLLLNEARTLLAQAKTEEDLQQALERVQALRVLVEQPERDRDITALQEEIEQEIQRLENGRRALRRAQRRLKDGLYDRSFQELSEVDVSPLLEEEIRFWREIAGQLADAFRHEEEAPQQALNSYLQVASQAPELAGSLHDRIRDCRERLFRQNMEEVTRLLAWPHPRPQQAQALLDAIEQEGWVETAWEREEMAQQRHRAQSLALLMQAVQHLQDGKDVETALSQLTTAASLSQDPKIHDLCTGWRAVAEAMQALQADDLSAATLALRDLPLEVTEDPFVQQVQQTLEARQALVEQLNTYEAQVARALAQRPEPDWEDAVGAANEAWELSAPPHPRAQALVDQIAQAIEEAALSLEERADYRGLSSLWRIWQKLPMQSERIGELQQTILQRYQTRWQERLSQIERAIQQNRLQEALTLLDAASLWLLPEDAAWAPEEMVRRYRQAWERLQGQRLEKEKTLQTVDEMITQARNAMLEEECEGAVETILNARQMAPEYENVHTLITELRERLLDQIQTKRRSGALDDALSLCRVAMNLDDEDRFQRLSREIQQEQTQIVSEAAREAQAALSILDLAEAERQIQRGRQADPKEPRLHQLAMELQKAKKIVDQLQEAMERGWRRLQDRAFQEARAAFRDASHISPQFSEPLLWEAYVDNLQKGLHAVEEERFEAAGQSFAEAARLLRLERNKKLSPLWGDRLERERRNGVYYAQRLAQEMMDIARQEQEVEALEHRRAWDEATRVLDALLARLDRFPNLVASIMEAPADFDFFEDLPSNSRPSPTPSPMTSSRPSSPPPDTPPQPPRQPSSRSESPVRPPIFDLENTSEQKDEKDADAGPSFADEPMDANVQGNDKEESTSPFSTPETQASHSTSDKSWRGLEASQSSRTSDESEIETGEMDESSVASEKEFDPAPEYEEDDKSVEVSIPPGWTFISPSTYDDEEQDQ